MITAETLASMTRPRVETARQRGERFARDRRWRREREHWGEFEPYLPAVRPASRALDDLPF